MATGSNQKTANKARAFFAGHLYNLNSHGPLPLEERAMKTLRPSLRLLLLLLALLLLPLGVF